MQTSTNPTAASGQTYQTPYSRRCVPYAIGLVLAVSVLNVVDRYKSDLGLSDTQMGLLLGPAFSGVHFLAVPRMDVGVGEGDTAYLWLASANRDDSHFEDPDRFDVDRANAGEHRALSDGPTSARARRGFASRPESRSMLCSIASNASSSPRVRLRAARHADVLWSERLALRPA